MKIPLAGHIPVLVSLPCLRSPRLWVLTLIPVFFPSRADPWLWHLIQLHVCFMDLVCACCLYDVQHFNTILPDLRFDPSVLAWPTNRNFSSLSNWLKHYLQASYFAIFPFPSQAYRLPISSWPSPWTVSAALTCLLRSVLIVLANGLTMLPITQARNLRFTVEPDQKERSL